MRRLLALAAFTSLTTLGCRPPEAPTTIEEMMVYGFEHFADDPEYTVALARELVPAMEANAEELSEGYEVNSLTAEHVAAAGLEGVDMGGVIGAASGLDYSVGLDELAFGLSYPEQTEIFEAYVSYERLEETPRPCFLDGECEFHEGLNSVHADLGAGIEMWNEYTQELRWVDDPDTGDRYLIVRVLGPTPVELSVDWMEVVQQYGYSFVWLGADGEAARCQAIWVEGRVLDSDAPETFALNLGINNLHNSAEQLDEWLLAQ